MRGIILTTALAACLGLSACGGGGSAPSASVGGSGTGSTPPPPPPPPPPQPETGDPTLWSNYFGDTSPGDRLAIPAGDTVVLDDCAADIFSLEVRGTFRVNQTTADSCGTARFTTRTLLATGEDALIEFGTQAEPFAGKLEITLTGDVDGETLGMAEQRAFMVMQGAELRAHGTSATKRSWTFLDETVLRDERRLVLAGETGWTAGDEIVLASSNIDPREAERAVVASVKRLADDRDAVTLEQGLSFDHFGRVLSYGGKTIDQRAEVGLLSHNIVIQGDDTSPATGIGGHLMVMNAEIDRPGDDSTRPAYDGKRSFMEIAGAEFRRIGQRGRAGRYPIQWHLVDDGSGQSARKVSVHDGLQRAVNIHGTDNVTEERVVAYDISNHVFVPSEEGDEINNVFRENLGILSKAVSSEHFAFPGDGSRSGQSEQRASVFWLRNTFNTLEGNRAAGAYRGQGYFMDPAGRNGLHKRLAYQASGELEVCKFRNNAAHSIYVGLGSPDLYSPAVKGFGIFMRTRGYRVRGAGPDGEDLYSHCTYDGFEAYKTQNGGVWIEFTTTLKDAIITNSHTGVVAGDVLEDIVVVGQTENDLRAFNANGVPSHLNRSRGGFMQSNNGGQSIRDRKFIGLTCVNLDACFNNMVNKQDEIAWYTNAAIDDVRLVNTAMGFVAGREMADPVLAEGQNIRWGTYTDVDGSLTGTPGRTGSMDDPEFQTLKTRQQTQFGWDWSRAPQRFD